MLAAGATLQTRNTSSAVVIRLRPHFRPDDALVDYYLEKIGTTGFTLY
jgi:hypothetical protein